MKTTPILALALLLNCSALFAQSKTTIGTIVSPMAANFRDAPDFLPKSWMPTLSIGIAHRVQSKKALFFQTELSFERKGFNLKDIQWTDFNATIIGTATLRSQFDYFTFSPTVGFATRGKVHFEGSWGLFCGYLVQQKDAFVNKSSDFPTGIFQSDIDNFNRFDAGMTARAGVGFDLKQKWSMTVNAIGNLGFAKPYKPVSGGSPEFGNDKTVAVGLQLGLFYKI